VIRFRTGKPAARRAVRPAMNVTPLVDVVLVLLIIFMVVTPMMQHAARVDLPGILNTDRENKGQMDPITVSLTATGELFYEQQPIDRPTLERTLVGLHRSAPDRRIVLRGDREADFGEARALFALCRGIGFSGVSLMVGERQGERKERRR
jgi:biopolymer transport protein ExbD/biopolymer transport protein TolR